MSALINLKINLDNLPKEKFVKGKKGTYYSFTVSVNDDTNTYGQNASVFDSQSKEQREAKEPREIYRKRSCSLDRWNLRKSRATRRGTSSCIRRYAILIN